ncbi:MAG: hypothetical protein ACTSP9_01965 [Promethearchaeota archaeon]
MDEQNEKKNEKEVNGEEGFDPTKEAFFSDMNDMQEEIMNEAYELVKHALSLLETYYFDDAIEIIRQAIGLYEQVNGKQEVDALYAKISEIQLMKEKRFREKEFEIEVDEEEISQESEIGEVKKKKLEILISEAEELIKNHQFDKALDKYDETVLLCQQLNDTHGQEQMNKMIEECYNKKAEYLRQLKVPETSSEDKKADKLKLFEETKLKESQISSQAFELVGKASELAKGFLFDEALKIYHESVILFEEINWMNEAKKINKIIDELQRQKIRVEETAEQARLERERVRLNALRKEEKMIEESKNIEEMQAQAKALKLKEFSEKKQEEDEFRLEISNKVDYVEKLVREYELGMKKAIKQGSILVHSVYPEVITIFESIKEIVSQRGWKDQVKIYEKQIKFYNNKLSQDFKLREIEAKKAEKQKIYEDSLKIIKKEEKSVLPTSEDVRSLERQEQESRLTIDNLIKSAEKMAREYDIAFRKAIKKGNLDIISKYPQILEIYTQARTFVSQKGWIEEAAVFSSHIKKYTDLYNKELKIREIEAKKIEKDREFETMHKIQTSDATTDIKIQKIKTLEEDRIKEEEALEFRKQIDSMVKSADRMAREYDIAFKRAIKKGNLDIISKYPEILELYTQARTFVSQKGWIEEAAIYSTHIKNYTGLYNKEQKIREIEAKKLEKDKEFEELKRINKEDSVYGFQLEKLKLIEEKQKTQKEDEKFENEIDNIINSTVKEAREYEMAIKRGKFEKDCPYLKISELYEEIYKQVYKRGWKEESKLYKKQVVLFREKFEKDNRLRKLELEKIEKQKVYEESLKVSSDAKTSNIQKLQELEGKRDEKEIQLNQAMNLINEAENAVRSYELSIKKDIILLKSPYDDAILKYEQAKKIFKDIEWIDESNRLIATIKFYKEKKVRDDNLRDLEMQKLENKKKMVIKTDQTFGKTANLQEMRALKFETSKKEKVSKADIILNGIIEAEKIVKDYELELKKGNLNIECPYEQIIDMYREAKLKFEQIGWLEQAAQIVNSISHYQEKLISDENLRKLEKQKLQKEGEELQKLKVETKLAREAEAELMKQKIQALELREQKVRAYESKKDQAFDLMDLAKRELQLNKFETAIKYYNESEKIFLEINWKEGIQMVKGSIKAIKKKKEKLEYERKLKIQQEQEKLAYIAQMDEKISKAHELKKMQEDQKRQEFLVIQRQKEQERSISEQAYKLLEIGTELKDKKKFDEAHEKYIMARDLFKKLEWAHEVSRINNDLLFILKREMKQTEKLKALNRIKIDKEQEIEALLKDADIKRNEQEIIKKEEKRKKREEFVNEEWERAGGIIKDLKYNEAIAALKKVGKKLKKMGKDKLLKQLNKQIETLISASQVPIITIYDVKKGENIEKFEVSYRGLDSAQISLSKNQHRRAISELNEVKFNLQDTLIGREEGLLPLVENTINSLKNEVDGKSSISTISKPQETEIEEPAKKEDDLRTQISARRSERKKRIKELLEKK